MQWLEANYANYACVAYRLVLCHSHQCLDSQLALLTPACTRCGYQGEAHTMSYT